MLCLYRWLPALTLAASLHAQITEPWPTRPLGLPSATTQGALIPWPEGLSTEATPIFEADGVSIASGSAEVIQIKGKPFLSATFETSNCLKTVYSLSAIDPVTGITFAGTGELTVGFLAVDRDVIQVEVGQSATIMVDRFFDSLELKTDCSAEEVADFVLAPDSNSITVTGRIPNRVTCRILPQVRSRETAEAKFIHIRVVEKTTTACTEDVNYVAQVASAAGDTTLLRDAGIAPGVELDCETDFSMAFTYLVCNGGSQGMSFILEQDGCIYRMSGHIGDDIRLRSELTIDGSTVTGSGILDLIMSPNGPPQAEFTFEGTRKLDDDDARGTVDIEVFVTTIPARGGAVRATVYAPGRAPIVLELDGEPDWVEAVDDSDPVFVPAIRPEQSAQGGPILRGSGVILFRAEPNPNTASREASFTIAGHPLTITQTWHVVDHAVDPARRRSQRRHVSAGDHLQWMGDDQRRLLPRRRACLGRR